MPVGSREKPQSRSLVIAHLIFVGQAICSPSNTVYRDQPIVPRGKLLHMERGGPHWTLKIPGTGYKPVLPLADLDYLPHLSVYLAPGAWSVPQARPHMIVCTCV
jgi:hypothetical protein